MSSPFEPPVVESVAAPGDLAEDLRRELVQAALAQALLSGMVLLVAGRFAVLAFGWVLPFLAGDPVDPVRAVGAVVAVLVAGLTAPPALLLLASVGALWWPGSTEARVLGSLRLYLWFWNALGLLVFVVPGVVFVVLVPIGSSPP